MRAVVTGASGFIGRRVRERLRAEGREVAGIDLVADPANGVVAGDLAVPGAWGAALTGADLVVHTAARVSMRPGLEPFWRANVLGTRNAVDAAAKAGVARFVHLSSVVAFGFDYEPGADERHPVRTNGVPYVDTKVASEQVVLAAHAAGELSCTVVRPGDVYGPGSRFWTELPVSELRAGRLVLPAMGRGIVTPVFVDNLVDGVLLAATTAEAGGHVFTLTDGADLPAREFFGHYARMVGRRVRVAPTAVAVALAAGASRLMPGSEVNAAAARYLARRGGFSIDKARAMLGYEPAVGIDVGMARSRTWLAERGLLD